MAIVNKIRIHGDKMEDVTIIEKILRSMTAKYNYVVCSIEESKDTYELSIDELQSSLNGGRKSNFAEKEMSLLISCHEKEETHKNWWYLDTGCSNHMCGDKSAFSNLDESFYNSVKFGDDSKVSVMGKGNVKIHIKEKSNQIISNIFFVPNLKTNLLSVGQLQEKGYEISIKDGVYRIQDKELGLIAQVNMATNRMFPLYLDNTTQSCFSVR
ncbi:uncharacterized protein LOC132296087 [Cornus florida]|uniref:uncharacterized protein LOC132296087 n=1 Tax=Cornus florida TaxID=4283 RepID=UPI0028A1E00F|nr:uncharacterized protein LOC132296087 [Cornus florida]